MNALFDVVVLGGGVAGIACAAELKKPGANFHLLEARNRLGGRVLTVRSRTSHVRPVELGAEFIHGCPAEILSLMTQFQIPFVDAGNEHLWLKQGRLVEVNDFFEHIDKLMPDKKIQKDRSIELYLKSKKVSPEWKGQFRSFVEGFHAADIRLMGIKALSAAMESDEEGPEATRSFRHLAGYDQVVEALSQTLNQGEFSLNSLAQKITWKKDGVEVHGRSTLTSQPFVARAKKLIVTLPMGVLKDFQSAKRLEWNPEPMGLRASLEAIEMGHVQRLVLRFRSRFWEDLRHERGKIQNVSFLHSAPQNFFPTWWTESPLRTPNLIAWQGGPRAEAMGRWKSTEMLSAALVTLAKITGRSSSFLRRELSDFYHHNWSTDPFTRGAYSYVRAGGVESARRLARPFSQTVFLAGEGICFDSSRGTVHGAIRTGIRGAHLAMKSLTSS